MGDDSDHNCWERPEDMDTNRVAFNITATNPGTELAAETAAALAAASVVFKTTDPAYSALCLLHATQVMTLDQPGMDGRVDDGAAMTDDMYLLPVVPAVTFRDVSAVTPSQRDSTF